MNVLDNIFGFIKNISNTDIEEVDTSLTKTHKSDLTASDERGRLERKTRVKKYKRSKLFYGKYKCAECYE